MTDAGVPRRERRRGGMDGRYQALMKEFGLQTVVKFLLVLLLYWCCCCIGGFVVLVLLLYWCRCCIDGVIVLMLLR